MNLRLILLGPPGSGKGTQAARVAARYDLTHISSGDLMRAEVATGTSMGREMRSYLDRGDLVPDELVVRLIAEPVLAAERAGGYVLDGFPRTRAQAEIARDLAERAGVASQAALLLDAPPDVLVARLLRRGATSRRADDDEAVIRHRLDVHEANEGPIADYYEGIGILHRIDATPEPDAVAEVVAKIVDAIDVGDGAV